MGEIEDDRKDVNTCKFDEVARGTRICGYIVLQFSFDVLVEMRQAGNEWRDKITGNGVIDLR